MTGWSELTDWSKLVLAALDLQVEERSYKLITAQRWSRALAAIDGDEEGWQQLLRSAAGSGNLVDQFAQTWLRNQIDRTPDQVRVAFGELHRTGAVDAIDGFTERLRSFRDYVSPGDITCFASLVLLAIDASAHPPYRAQFVADWAKLVVR